MLNPDVNLHIILDAENCFTIITFEIRPTCFFMLSSNVTFKNIIDMENFFT